MQQHTPCTPTCTHIVPFYTTMHLMRMLPCHLSRKPGDMKHRTIKSGVEAPHTCIFYHLVPKHHTHVLSINLRSGAVAPRCNRLKLALKHRRLYQAPKHHSTKSGTKAPHIHVHVYRIWRQSKAHSLLYVQYVLAIRS